MLIPLPIFYVYSESTICFSLLPAIVLHPQFVAAGTKLYATGYPGENATLTCEALGGLSIPGGLQLSLLRGAGLKALAEQAISAKGGVNGAPNTPRPPPSSVSPYLNTPPTTSTTSSMTTTTTTSGFGDNDAGDRIEVIRTGMDPRYELTAGPDPRNPYAAMIRLTITSEFCDFILYSNS